jgi:CRISPR-associated exonuclease Cas4
MYPESALLPISALQHLIYCERQCALIHIERLWSENLFTAQGRVLHKRTDEQRVERRGAVRVETGLLLRSLELGLSGKADVVEFHPRSGQPDQPFPVEYKRGCAKKNLSDKIQLCAQALCLEEMLEIHVPAGALFYGKTKRRLDVPFDESMRKETKRASQRLHELITNGQTPPAEYGKKCEACSLAELCMPRLGGRSSVSRYLKKAISES